MRPMHWPWLYAIIIVTGFPEESGQTHLNYLMTRRGLILARAEDCIQKVGVFNRDIQQGTFAGGLIMCHCRRSRRHHR